MNWVDNGLGGWNFELKYKNLTERESLIEKLRKLCNDCGFDPKRDTISTDESDSSSLVENFRFSIKSSQMGKYLKFHKN